MKIRLRGSRFGPDTFADVDAAPGACKSRLLVYAGGAISPAEYLARRDTSPTELLSVLRPAGASYSVLVLPYSPALPGRPEDAAELLVGHFHDELLPALPLRPERMAILGSSLGAASAVLLARAVGGRVGRLATLGAVGAAEALALERPCLVSLSGMARVAWNTGDPCAPHSARFVAGLEETGVRHEVETGPGGHSWQDYLTNGLLPAAVAFAARGLTESL